MATHLTILRLLADGEMHSGAAIANRLGLSRTAVWKALGRLGTEFGIETVAVRGRGYRLAEPLELLDTSRIRAALPAPVQSLVDEIEVHASIDSTNARLMDLATTGAPAGRVCLAEHQRQGRGRHGRTWVSPFGRGVLLSVLWRYSSGPSGLAGLSLAAGAAVAAILRDYGVSDIALKWPNDILWQRRKLAGLLLEVAGEAQGPSHVVVGLGINLRLSADQGRTIDQPWVDLATALGMDYAGRNRLAALLIEALIVALDRFGREGLASFLPIWEGFDRYRGEPILVLLGGQAITGIHAGITAQGALRLQTDSGEQTFQAGEASLTPMASRHPGS